MLKGLSPLLTPELLHILASMGHGDEIVLADANFPAATHAKRLVRMPGLSAPAVLDAVLSVLPLDNFVTHAALTMQVVGDASSVPPAVAAKSSNPNLRVLVGKPYSIDEAQQPFALHDPGMPVSGTLSHLYPFT